MHEETWGDPFRQIGLKPRYLAHLLGVSYSTAANWMYGKVTPCKLVANSANIARTAAIRALETNQLPLNDPSMLPAERDVLTMRRLRKLMREVEVNMPLE